jgi:glutaredoxin
MAKTHAALYRMEMSQHVCPYGLKSRHLLRSQGFEVEDHILDSREAVEAFKAQHLSLNVLERIDPVPSRRDPLDGASACRIIKLKRACKLRALQPAQPHRPAQMIGDDAMLELLDAPAELNELGAQG